MGFVLVTGTDSGVGKTWVTRALARALIGSGRRVLAVKPVETGCDGTARNGEDGVLLASATGQRAPTQALYRFPERLAPAPAADRRGRPVDFDAMLLQLEPLRAEADVVLLEGTGGLLTPITWEWNVAELARSLGAGVLVVSPDRLGTVNLALLTLGALELAGLGVHGVVLTPPATPDASTGTNAAAIARLSGVERVAVVPYEPDPLSAPAVAALAGAAEWVARPLPEAAAP